jgi:hypothetical protein
MNTPTKNASLTFDSSTRLKYANPFLRNCGNFSQVSHSQPSKDDYLKYRQHKLKTNLQRTNLSVLNVGAEKPKGLPEEAWECENDEDFVRRILKGEKRQLISKFTLSKRTEDMFMSVKAQAEFLHNRLKLPREAELNESCEP